MSFFVDALGWLFEFAVQSIVLIVGILVTFIEWASTSLGGSPGTVTSTFASVLPTVVAFFQQGLAIAALFVGDRLFHSGVGLVIGGFILAVISRFALWVYVKVWGSV